MAEVDELERSLALAQIGLAAPPGVRERVRAKLGTVGAATNARTPVERSRGPSNGALSSIARRGVPTWGALTLAGLGFAAGYLLGRRPARLVDEPARQVLAGATEIAKAETTARPLLGAHPDAAERSASERFESEASQARVKEVHVRPRSTRRATAPDGLAAELALLQRAERAIRASNADLAVALLDQLDREQPKAQLMQEREAARLLAECERSAQSTATASGPSAATEQARQYLARHPASVYSERIRNLCGLDVAGSSSPATVSSGAAVQTSTPKGAEESPSSGH